MTKKNKSKRNKGLDYFPSLYMMLDDYPINKYDGLTMPSLQMNLNSGSFWRNPTLGLDLGTLSNILNNVPLLTPPLVSPLIPGTTGKKSLTDKINNMGELGQMALMSGAGITGNVLGNALAGGKTSGVGNTIGTIGSSLGGIAGTVLGGPLGGIVGSFAGNLMGGVWNSMFGSKMNYENINKIENELSLGANYNSSANNFEALTEEIMNAPSLSYFSKSDIGSDGLFSNKASRKFRELSARKKFVEDWIARSLANTATNLQLNQLNDLLMGWFAYGGPLDNSFGGGAIDYDLANQQLGIDSIKAMGLNRQYSLPNMGLNTFAKGGKIHIKPENRGKFTALKKRTGKSATWFKKHGTPALRKMATFELNARKWKHAFGGDLLTNGTVFSNGVTTIGNGGTHEESPYEGVLMGIDPLGIPNLVEEGETVWNDYVFSNRIPVPNAVRNKYKLRGTKDMSFSDAAKKVQKASEERPNDPIAQDTLDINLSRLALEQEIIRELKNMELNRLYAKGGILGNKGNLFFTGGPYEYGKDILNREKYNDLDALYDENSEYMKKRRYMMDNWNTDYVKNFIKNEYIPFVLKYNKSRGYKGNFTVNLNLFDKGTFDGDFGGMHQGVLNFVIPETSTKQEVLPMNIYTTRGRKGGDISINPEALDFYGYSVPLDIIETTKDSEGNTINYLQNLTNNNTKTSKSSKLDDILPPLTSRWFDETVLRYAPVVGSAIGLGLTLFSNPDYSRADALALYAQNAGEVTPISYDPLGNYLTYRPNDVEYIANKMAALAAATRRGIMNTSGGNRANAVGSLLAADYNALLALADAIRQGEDTNWNRYVLTETFNRGTNLYNSEAALKAAMANQEAKLKASQLGLSGYSTAMLMKDAIDALRNASISANLTNLFDSLGDIGREGVVKRMVKDSPALLYDYYGRYKSNKGAKGGKLNKKKRGGFTY